MSETKDKQVRLVLSEEKLERWDEFWEDDPEYSNRSDLIRKAVAHEMAGGHQSVDGPDTSELSVQMGELLDRMDDMVERFGSVDERLRALESEARKDPEISKLTSDVFSVLPTEEQFNEFYHPKNAGLGPGYVTEEDGGPAALSGSIADVANALDVTERKAQRAIEKLREDTHLVQETEDNDGDPLYYKEV